MAPCCGYSSSFGIASDNVAVAKVEVSIDGGAGPSPRGRRTGPFSINTLSLLNGTHTISARATDGSGNVSSIPSITVRVFNVPGPISRASAPATRSPSPTARPMCGSTTKPYSSGSFGLFGQRHRRFCQLTPFPGSARMRGGSTSGSVTAPLLPGYSYFFDCPARYLRNQLLEARDLLDSTSGQSVFNVFLRRATGADEFRHFCDSGRPEYSRSALSSLPRHRHAIGNGFYSRIIDNARASGIQVRKIADLDSDGDGIPDWWMLAYFNHPPARVADSSLANQDADGTGQNNLFKYVRPGSY